MAKVRVHRDLRYRGFADLPIYNFYQIITTQNMAYFYKSFVEGDDMALSEEEEIELLGLFRKVFEDRIEYTNDTKTREYVRKLTEISDLETKLFRIQNSFNIMLEIPTEHKAFIDFIMDFREEGFKFDKDVEDDDGRVEYFTWLQRKIKRFKNKVSARKLQYKDILHPPKKETGVRFDLMKEKILLEEGLNRVIDIYTCSVKEWTALIIRAEEKAKIQKAQAERMKHKRR